MSLSNDSELEPVRKTGLKRFIEKNNNDGKPDEVPAKIIKTAVVPHIPRPQMSIYGPHFRYGPNRRTFKNDLHVMHGSQSDESDSDNSSIESNDNQSSSNDQLHKKDEEEDGVEDNEVETEEEEEEEEEEPTDQTEMNGEKKTVTPDSTIPKKE